MSTPKVSTERPSLLYRALRPNEIFTLLKTGKLLPPCTPCPNAGPCCNITVSAHINSGSKALLKSRYISTTKSPAIAALWASAKKNGDGSLLRLPNTIASSGVFVEIDTNYPNHLELMNPQNPDYSLGKTAINSAKASQEILIEDEIPFANIRALYKAEQVTQPIWNAWTEGKSTGKKTQKNSKINVIWGPIGEMDISDNYKELLGAESQRSREFNAIFGNTDDLLEEMKNARVASADARSARTASADLVLPMHSSNSFGRSVLGKRKKYMDEMYEMDEIDEMDEINEMEAPRIDFSASVPLSGSVLGKRKKYASIRGGKSKLRKLQTRKRK